MLFHMARLCSFSLFCSTSLTIILIHLNYDGHLVYFQLGAAMCSADTNTLTHVFWRTQEHFLLGMYVEVRLLDYICA